MNRRIAKQPKKHSQRVAAWIYAVINPIVEGLQRELELLERGNATWRHFSQRCEFIRPVQEYVDSLQWPNYTDFLVDNPEFKDRFHSHDEALDAVNNSASALYGWLISFPGFKERLELSLRAYEERRTTDPRGEDLMHMKEDLHKHVAEYLINNIQTVPSHYITSRFWAEASSSMLGLTNMNNFQPVRSAVAGLKSISLQVRTTLEDHRRGLSRKYDLPAAPIPDYIQRR